MTSKQLNVLKDGKAPDWLPRHLHKYADKLESQRALRSAVTTGNVRAVEELFALGALGDKEALVAKANLNAALQKAVDKHDLEGVKRLLDQGADPNTREVGLIRGRIRSFPVLACAGWYAGGMAYSTPEGRMAFEIGVQLEIHGAILSVRDPVWDDNWVFERMSEVAFERKYGRRATWDY